MGSMLLFSDFSAWQWALMPVIGGMLSGCFFLLGWFSAFYYVRVQENLIRQRDIDDCPGEWFRDEHPEHFDELQSEVREF